METKTISLNELQEIEKSILGYFHEVCVENGLRYCLAGGSLLGAIRHNGFIPWDDDIDVHMPMPDYNKLIKILGNNIEGRYKLLCIDNTEDYIYPFAKLIDSNTELDEYLMENGRIGVFIDIFPLWALPTNSLKRELLRKYIFFLGLIRVCARKKQPIGKNRYTTIAQRLIMPIAKRIGSKRLNTHILKIANSLEYDCSKYVSITFSGYRNHYGYRKEWFDELELHTFEDKLFYIPSMYDEYLKYEYGDYMILPPENKRNTQHFYKVVLKDSV